MKILNKLFCGLILAFLASACASVNCHAGSLPRSPKATFVTPFQSVQGSTVTPTISTNAVANAAFESGAIYEVLLSSGAASEYLLLIDSGNCTGITTGMLTTALNTGAKFITPRLFFSSTTANTDYKFDPPLFFENGLCVMDSALTGQASITYELGRGISGN